MIKFTLSTGERLTHDYEIRLKNLKHRSVVGRKTRFVILNRLGVDHGSMTLCGILLFHGVLQFAGKQTRRAAAAWGTALLQRDWARAAAREKQLNEQK